MRQRIESLEQFRALQAEYMAARNCPAGAITGELKKPHHIDTDKCIKCGTCKTGCPFGAIKEA